jgi:hypothetical protein
MRHGRVTGEPEGRQYPADMMLGPGGRITTPQSEGSVIASAISDLERALPNMVPRDQEGVRHAQRLVEKALRDLQALHAQVSSGYHRNPHMMILSNPPLALARKYGDLHGPIRVVGEISGEAHAILYRHKDDRKPYEHAFEHPTSLLAITRAGHKDVLITSPDGSPIWQDF